MTILSALLDAGLVAAPLAAVRVDFDRSVFYAAVIFVALALVLQPLLFEPILKIFQLREQRTEGARAEARELQERAGELLRKLDGELDRIRRVAAEERDTLRAATLKLEAKIIDEARESTAAIVADGRAQLDAEIADLRRDLDGRTATLAREIAAGLLGREVR